MLDPQDARVASCGKEYSFCHYDSATDSNIPGLNAENQNTTLAQGRVQCKRMHSFVKSTGKNFLNHAPL